MKGPRRLSVSVVILLAGCAGGDTLNPRAEPSSPPAAPDPPPAAASVAIEIPKVLEDRLTHTVVDLDEWVSADTTFIGYAVVRVTARDHAGHVVTGAEPVVRFASGGDSVTYRPLNGDRLQEVRLQRSSLRGVWNILTGETPAETQFLPIMVYDGYERCTSHACGGARGPRVEREEGDGFYFARGGLYWSDDGVYATPFGQVPTQATWHTMLHELGHAFGIGTYWHYGDVQLVNASHEVGRGADTHFPGPNAVAAFDEAGGSGYGGGKVPVMNNPFRLGADQHWRSVVCGKIMSYYDCGDRRVVSAITLGALADFGWIVDMSVAEEYALPSADMAASILADSIVGHDDVVMLVEPPPDRR